MHIIRFSMRKPSVISEAWRRVRKDREKIKRSDGDLYEKNYWNMTKRWK